MKKIIVILGMLVSLFVNANAKNLEITKDALDIIKGLSLKSDFVKVKTNKGDYYLLKHNSKSRDFDDLSDTDINVFLSSELTSYKNKIKIPKNKRFIQVNSTNFPDDDGVCRSLIYSTAGLDKRESRKASKGNDISRGQYIKPGTVLYSHNNKKLKKIGHVVIFLKKVSDGIWVIDQNQGFYEKGTESFHRGIVSIHKIKYGKIITDKKSNDYYEADNAFNYAYMQIP
jgi:hypothetical protein